MKHWLAAVTALALLPSPAPAASHPVPAEFVNDLIYVRAAAPDGTPVRFYTDSGGGWNAIATPLAKRLALPALGTMPIDGETLGVVEFPDFLVDAGIPAPRDRGHYHGGLVSAPPALLYADGTLGSTWYGGRVWEIDYAARRLARLDDYAPEPKDHRVDLHFRSDADGRRERDFPRVEVRVDGEPLSALLDTGANSRVAPEIAAALGRDADARTASAFVIGTVFRRWQKAHPDWQVVDQGERWPRGAFPMIRVPSVEIGGVATGPVWFALRDDRTFHDAVDDMMDAPAELSIGGAALHYLHVVIDYPKAVAWVRRPD